MRWGLADNKAQRPLCRPEVAESPTSKSKRLPFPPLPASHLLLPSNLPGAAGHTAWSGSGTARGCGLRVLGCQAAAARLTHPLPHRWLWCSVPGVHHYVPGHPGVRVGQQRSHSLGELPSLLLLAGWVVGSGSLLHHPSVPHRLPALPASRSPWCTSSSSSCSPRSTWPRAHVLMRWGEC